MVSTPDFDSGSLSSNLRGAANMEEKEYNWVKDEVEALSKNININMTEQEKVKLALDSAHDEVLRPAIDEEIFKQMGKVIANIRGISKIKFVD